MMKPCPWIGPIYEILNKGISTGEGSVGDPEVFLDLLLEQSICFVQRKNTPERSRTLIRQRPTPQDTLSQRQHTTARSVSCSSAERCWDSRRGRGRGGGEVGAQH